MRSLLLLLLQLLRNPGLNGSPVNFSHLLRRPRQLLAVLLLADALEVFLAEGNNGILVNFVVAGQFEGSLPPVAIDVHANGPVVELILHVDLLRLIVLVEKQGQRCVAHYLRRTVPQLAQEDHLFGNFNGSEGSLRRLQLLVLERSSSQAGPQQRLLHEAAQLGGLLPLALLAEIQQNGGVGRAGNRDRPAVPAPNGDQGFAVVDDLRQSAEFRRVLGGGGEGKQVGIDENDAGVEVGAQPVVGHRGKYFELVVPGEGVADGGDFDALLAAVDSGQVEVAVRVQKRDLPLQRLLHLVQVDLHHGQRVLDCEAERLPSGDLEETDDLVVGGLDDRDDVRRNRDFLPAHELD